MFASGQPLYSQRGDAAGGRTARALGGETPPDSTDGVSAAVSAPHRGAKKSQAVPATPFAAGAPNGHVGVDDCRLIHLCMRRRRSTGFLRQPAPNGPGLNVPLGRL